MERKREIKILKRLLTGDDQELRDFAKDKLVELGEIKIPSKVDLFAALEFNRIGEVPLNILSANLHCRNKDGWSVLDLAAVWGQLNQLPAALLTEANMLVRDAEGNTPLHWAAQHGYLEQVPVDVLTEENLLVENIDGLTPIWKAAQERAMFGVPKALITEKLLMTSNKEGRTAFEVLASRGSIDGILGTELSENCKQYIAKGFGSNEHANSWYKENLIEVAAAKVKAGLGLTQEVQDVELF